jgi:biotin carboxyl carrier protein/CheY-like chemotaxis protein
MSRAVADERARVLIIDSDEASARFLRHCLGGSYSLTTTRSAADALELLGAVAPDVIIAAGELADAAGAHLLRAARHGHAGPVPVLVTDGPVRAAVDPAEVLATVHRAVWRRQRGDADAPVAVLPAAGAVPAHRAGAPVPVRGGPGGLEGSAPEWIGAPEWIAGPPALVTASGPPAPRSAAEAADLKFVLEVARRLAAQPDLAGAARVLARGARSLAGADRARCLFYEGSEPSLWEEDGDGSLPPGRGLAWVAAQSRQGVLVAPAASDPRYEPGCDDPEGTGAEALVALPLCGSDGQVQAVLLLVRLGPAFARDELQRLALLARAVAAPLHQLALEGAVDELLDEAAPEQALLFRSEAVAARAGGAQEGALLRVTPGWVRHAYRLLVALLVVGLGYLSLATVSEYSSGPAIVVASGRTEVTATAAGAVVAVEVLAGQRVEAGQRLARLHDAQQAAALVRAERDFAAQLRTRMLDPESDAIGASLLAARRERDLASELVVERQISAPHAGVVGDVHVHPGQHLEAGDVVASVVRGDGELGVLALLPGNDRPLLRPGMPLHLQLSGVREPLGTLQVASVAEEVVGPAEARRLLGPQFADAVAIRGPVCVVRARIAAPALQRLGERLHDGMHGTAEVEVRTRSILGTLFPEL